MFQRSHFTAHPGGPRIGAAGQALKGCSASEYLERPVAYPSLVSRSVSSVALLSTASSKVAYASPRETLSDVFQALKRTASQLKSQRMCQRFADRA